MVWKLPSRTYIKDGCTSEALKDLLEKNIKSIVIIFSETFFSVAIDIKKKIKTLYKNEKFAIQLVRDDEEFPKHECAILVTDAIKMLDIKYRLHSDIKLVMSIIPPAFNAGTLFINDNEKETYICDLYLFHHIPNLGTIIKTSAADVFLTTFFYFIKNLVSKKVEEDLSFIIHMESLAKLGRHLKSEKLDPFFFASVLTSLELNQARERETTPHEMIDTFKKFRVWNPNKLSHSKEEICNVVKRIVIVNQFTSKNLEKLSNDLISLTEKVFSV